jgi:outer membrane protein assembly factor BamE (lipoprotein component of BamABCDE complex)
MKRTTLLFSLLFVLLTAGCSIPVEIGRPVTLANLQSIDKGMSSQQVTSLLGEPMATGLDSDGDQTWTWFHLRVILPVKADAAPEMQRVSVTFNSEERVLYTTYDLSKPAE